MRFVAITAIFLALIAAGMVFINHSTDQSIAARIQILGIWRSTQDSKFTREFKNDGKVIDAYEGSSLNSDGRWVIFTKQMPIDALPEALEDGAVYLSIAAPESEAQYFKIASINSHELQLVYLDRGGIISFTKIQ